MEDYPTKNVDVVMTRGQVAGSKPGVRGKGKKGLSGGAILEPPDKTDAPTRAELGLEKKRAIQSKAVARIGLELAKQPKAKGTAGQARGRDVSGGTVLEPPENDAPSADLPPIGGWRAAALFTVGRMPFCQRWSGRIRTIFHSSPSPAPIKAGFGAATLNTG